jgi:hypothetical protein
MVRQINVVAQRESSPLRGSTWTKMPAAWAAAGKVDATKKNAMLAVYKSHAERKNSNGDASRDLRQRNVDFGCPSMLRRSKNQTKIRFQMLLQAHKT